MVSHDKSHDECGKVVHRPCSSCISSVENLMGTLLSFPCQLGLGEYLSHLWLSHYTQSMFKETVKVVEGLVEEYVR